MDRQEQDRALWDILGQSVAVLDQPASRLTNDRYLGTVAA